MSSMVSWTNIFFLLGIEIVKSKEGDWRRGCVRLREERRVF
jgi:hypothetical protein